MNESKKELSTIQKFAIIGGAIALFIIITIGFFYVFKNAEVELSVATIISVISGGIIVWIILSASGILREFSIKSPFFEMASKIDDVKKETEQVKSEVRWINNKIETMISNIVTRAEVTNIQGDYYESKGEFKALAQQAGLKPENVKRGLEIQPELKEEITQILNKISALEKVIGKSEFDSNYTLMRALYYERIKKYQKALELYKQILYHDDKDFYALFGAGLCLAKLNKYEDANYFFKKASEIRPEDPDVLTNIGNNYRRLNNFPEAIKYLEKAIDINPVEVRALANLCLIYHLEDNKNKLSEYAERVFKITPKELDENVDIGIVYSLLGEHRKAIKFYDKVIKVIENPYALYNKACAVALLDDKEQAIELLEKSISLDPHYKDSARRDEDRDLKNIRDHPKFRKLIE